MNMSEIGVAILFTIALSNCVSAYGQDTVFNKGKNFKYAVEYSDGNIHVKDTILITPTGKPWRMAPYTQKEIIITYHQAGLDTGIFAGLPSLGWIESDTTGFVENDEACWFHPPRHNQYKILELAPFPRVEYPLEKNRSYASILYIGDAWAELSNSKVTWNYTIVGELDGKWLISSRATPDITPNEVNTLDFTFHPGEGFDALYYNFSNGTFISMLRIPQ
jgi:hypothetical protein